MPGFISGQPDHAVSPRAAAARIALLYLAFAALWIYASDRVLAMFVEDRQWLVWLGMIKGVAYVLVTSLLLYVLLRNWSQAEEAPVPSQAALRRHWLAVVSLFLALVLPLLVYSVSRVEGPRIRDESFDELSDIAQLKTGQIEHWLAERKGDAEILMASPVLADDLNKWLRNRDPLARDDLDRQVYVLRQAHRYNVELLDPRNNTLDKDRQAVLAKALATRQVQMDGLRRDASGRVWLEMMVPVTGQDADGGHATGAFLLRAPASQSLFPLIQGWPCPSPSAETLLIRRDGDSVLFPSELHRTSSTPLNLRLPLDNPILPAAMASRTGKAQTFEGLDYRGVAVLSALRPVAGTDWFLLAKIDRDEVMRPVGTLVAWVSLVSFAAIIAMAATLTLLWRQQQRAHRLEIVAQSRETLKASQGQLRTFVEQAPTSMAMLDRNMNYLAASRRWIGEYGRGHADLAGRNHYEIHPDIPEHWKKIHRDALAGAFLRNDNDLWIQADGSQRWLRWAAYPWTNESGETGGIIISAEDITGHKQAEEALRTSERRLSALVDTAMDAIIAVNEDQKIVLFNPAAEQMFGLSGTEIIGQPLDRLLPEASRQAHTGNIRAFGRTGITSRNMKSLGTLHGLRANGEEFPIEASISQIELPSGKLFTVILRDISERIRAVEALKASEADLKHAQAVGLIGSWRMDVRRNVLTWSEENHRIFEVPEDTPMTYEFFLSTVHPDDRAYVDGEWQACLQGKSYDIEHRLLVNGRIKWVREKAELEFDEQGALTGGFGTTQDITRRKEAEEKLKHQLRLTQAITDCAADSIFVTDHEGRVTFLNAAAERTFGYAANELLGKVMHDMIHRRHADGRPYPFRECPLCQIYADGEAVQRIETVYFTKQGDPIAVACTNAPLEIEGQSAGAVLVAHDISAHKRIEAALREANERKNEFLALLAHELRNPMAVMATAVYMLQTKGLADRGMHEWATGTIANQTELLKHLVDDLLDVERVNRGRIALLKAPLDLRQLLERVVREREPLNRERHQHLAFKLTSLPLWIEGDPARLAQIINNLLDNASKFTPENGRIELSLERDGQDAVIRVRDTGRGISAKLLPHIFEIFTQGEVSLARGDGGLGLGLALVKGLVELHGGQVSAASGGPGKGAEFTVRLPALPGMKTAAPAPDSLKQPAHCQRRILIGEDNAIAAEGLKHVLQEAGHSVRMTRNGSEALTAAKQELPEVAILDIGLPNMDGYELARRLRRLPEGDSLLLIALTGYGQKKDRRQAKEAGFDYHFIKPADMRQLLDTINTWSPGGNT